MSDLIYRIQFYSDWHCGSGLSAGADADLLVIKDKNGLPFIPGKTMKGLILDGARTLVDAGEISKSSIVSIFGCENDKEQPPQGGVAYFSNANLTESIQRELCSDPNKKSMLYRNITSTAIEGNGQAKEHSLRSMEVTVPLTLFAKVSGLDDKQKSIIDKSLKMIKRLGTGRNRGLGRCDVVREEA